MADPTIPFGPGAEPLGLTASDFEYISLDGPQKSLDNESMSEKKDGKFLRWVATRTLLQYVANYLVLDDSAEIPDPGLYDASAGAIGSKVWLRNANVSKPQAGDQTLAVTFLLAVDTVNTEALRADVLGEPSGMASPL
jgi:hypothetical protein